jgi:2-polyprenyl-3-methyl-5-hydroxy-6-metoxy-1,4-benzoquinol methylase
MPSLQENLELFSKYEWPEDGEEWSKNWKGSATLWRATILPRISAFLPAGTVLEIAPGYGRCTQHLLHHCKRLMVVDICQNCIDACAQRFREHGHLEYHVGTGASLDFLPANSLDFVFSWDSLVHVEHEVISGYLTDLARTLRPGGTGFLHHSNMAEHVDAGGQPTRPNNHWRGATVSAKSVAETCAALGLRCLVQEKVTWAEDFCSDCFTVFVKDAGAGAGHTVLENADFTREVRYAGAILSHYAALDDIQAASGD